MKEKLIEMVKKSIPDKEIMEKLGIQTKASLKKMYYDALVETGKIKDIMTERKMKKAASRIRPLTIGKRGTILLSKALLMDQLGFKKGDRFTVAKRRDSIILRKTT
jgi:membrane-associated HD superfamily phosphohydrolase